MKRNRLLVLTLCILMIFSMILLSACSGDQDPVSQEPTDSAPPASDNDPTPDDDAGDEAIVADPFGKYDEPIDQTTIRILTSWMALDEGDDENNNIWSRAIRDTLGTNVTQLWTAPDWGPPFDEKVNLAIATDQLPDIIPVYTTLFYRMVDGGKLYDLTEVYEEYASPKLKEIMEMGDGVGLKSSTFDGKLYALGQPNDYSERNMLWLRQDWLDKLDLKPPYWLCTRNKISVLTPG